MPLMATATITRKRVAFHVDRTVLAREGEDRVCAIARTDVEARAQRDGFAVLDVSVRVASEFDLLEDPEIVPGCADLVTVLVEVRLIDA